MEKLRMKTPDASDGNVAKIAALFPQCVTERLGKDGTAELAIDFDKLRDELSKDLLDGAEERYQFTWPDKRAASRLANEPTDKTLRPDLDASVDFWNTKNLYIEGDNLDVLKVLRENYLGAIKMIYIDPPYNTGNDFVYNDDFAQSREDFEATSGAFDEEGNQLIDPMQRNTESNGRFHTDWLNMIYPRLKVARDLLSDDGVIFISIDDNEENNLKKLCDEIFGANNFVANLIWEKKFSPQNDDKYITTVHDYILLYAKCKENWRPKLQERTGDALAKFKNPDNDPRGVWTSGDMTSKTKAQGHSYTVISPSGKEFFPPQGRQWAPAYSTYQQLRAENRLWFGENGDNVPRIKQFLCEIQDGVVPTSILFRETAGHNQEAKKELMALVPKIGNSFETPKPSRLIMTIQKLVRFEDGDIILDFFSGSATTAHAVMKLNAEDGGKRKFIMVQLPEVTDEKSEARKAGYETICQIGEERIRRAGKKIKDELYTKSELRKDRAFAKGAIGDECDKPVSLWSDLYDEDEKSKIIQEGDEIKEQADNLDIGFRVLKLDSSNMEDVFYTPEDFDIKNIFTTVDNVKSDRTPLDLLFQVLPELNIELSAKIEEKEVNGKKVFFVDGDYLIATFDTEVNESTVTEIAKMKPQYFVMRDASAANDNVLDNFEQIFRHYSPETIRKIL